LGNDVTKKEAVMEAKVNFNAKGNEATYNQRTITELGVHAMCAWIVWGITVPLTVILSVYFVCHK
jgi:hypothetical protein